MSKKTKSHIKQPLQSKGTDTTHAIEFATAVLLVEMIRTDAEVNTNEREAVINALQSQFKLNESQSAELYQLAEAELKQTSDYSQFTDSLNQVLSYADKLKMIKNLWRVAYSDKQLHRDEAYFAQKISDLINVKQDDFDLCRNEIRNEVL